MLHLFGIIRNRAIPRVDSIACANQSFTVQENERQLQELIVEYWLQEFLQYCNIG